MYWKYSFETKDAVLFQYRNHIAEGTVLGWVKNDAFLRVEEEQSFDNIEPSDLELVVESGDTELKVNLEDVEKRIKFEDRKTDIPSLSERMRVRKGVDQIDRKIEKAEEKEKAAQ